MDFSCKVAADAENSNNLSMSSLEQDFLPYKAGYHNVIRIAIIYVGQLVHNVTWEKNRLADSKQKKSANINTGFPNSP